MGRTFRCSRHKQPDIFCHCLLEVTCHRCLSSPTMPWSPGDGHQCPRKRTHREAESTGVVLALGPDHCGFLYIFLFSTKVSLMLRKYTTTGLRASVLLTFAGFETGSYYSTNWHSTRDLPASAPQEAGIVDLGHQACLYMCVCVCVRAVPEKSRSGHGIPWSWVCRQV